MTESLDPREDFENPVVMDFEDPADKKPKSKKKTKKKEPAKTIIPQLPPPSKALTSTEVRRGVSDRDKAAVNLKLAGASYQDIAETLDYPDASQAKRSVERALAATHTPDDWETLRLVAAARAEQLFARSVAMAGADFLLDQDGEKIPNVDKLRWHQQAGIDLMNHATITGAKAPTKLEITPDEERLDALVSAMAHRMGVEDIVDAEVIELDAIPAPPSDDLGDPDA